MAVKADGQYQKSKHIIRVQTFSLCILFKKTNETSQSNRASMIWLLVVLVLCVSTRCYATEHNFTVYTFLTPLCVSLYSTETISLTSSWHCLNIPNLHSVNVSIEYNPISGSRAVYIVRYASSNCTTGELPKESWQDGDCIEGYTSFVVKRSSDYMQSVFEWTTWSRTCGMGFRTRVRAGSNTSNGTETRIIPCTALSESIIADYCDNSTLSCFVHQSSGTSFGSPARFFMTDSPIMDGWTLLIEASLIPYTVFPLHIQFNRINILSASSVASVLFEIVPAVPPSLDPRIGSCSLFFISGNNFTLERIQVTVNLECYNQTTALNGVLHQGAAIHVSGTSVSMKDVVVIGATLPLFVTTSA
jgi:hypothetical protein